MTNKDFVKTLFTILLYGGTIDTWHKEFGITENDYEASEFITAFAEQVRTITAIVNHMDTFKDIKRECWRAERDKAQEKHEGDKKNKTKFNDAEFNVPPGKTLSHILQHVESLIIEDCIALLKEGGVTITSYNYDGMQVLKQGFDETFVADMNAMVQERYYKTVSFIIKPFKAGLDLSQIEAQTVFNSDEFHLIDTHEYKKEYFEVCSTALKLKAQNNKSGCSTPSLVDPSGAVQLVSPVSSLK